MLAVFDKAVGKPPEELSLPSSERKGAKSKEEIAKLFESSRPHSTFFYFSGGNFMASSHEKETPLHPKSADPLSIVAMDDIFCIFVGNIENISDLRKHYGLSRNANEAMLLIEVYKVLRDRAPYPADQVIKDLIGNFAFVLYDSKHGPVFAARDRDGGVKLHWGVADDGSLVFSEDQNILQEICGKASSSFPAGCIFMNKTGLTSFVHPMYKVRGYRTEDDEGNISGVYFQVDLYTRLPSIPRVGSAQTWSDETGMETMPAVMEE